MRTVVLATTAATAVAFTPGVPLRLATPVVARGATDVVMMPKFLKDLFPDMEKPDDVLGGIKSFFGMKEEEPEPAPAEPEPEPEEEKLPEDEDEVA